MLNWAQGQTRPVLMIPGPTELPFPVIQAMNQPPAIQYVLPTLSAPEMTLRDLGHAADPGAGVAAAQRVLATGA